MSYTVSIDIGGTFTDCLVRDGNSRDFIFKTPTTPPNFEKGFVNALRIAGEHFGFDLRSFVSKCDRIVHGTTVSTNALVEGKTAATGFLCNKGHPDILLLREAPRKRSFDFKLDYPEPYIPRNLTCEVAGRIDAAGNQVEALSADDVLAAVERFKRSGVEAIAVCFMWSTVNGLHEQKARDIIKEVWPEVHVTLSHELNPIPREYRRAVSAAIDASLFPVVATYVTSLERELVAVGFDTAKLLIANCAGGMAPSQEIIARPIYSVMSGPTLAPVAAQRLSSEDNIIVADMGGTTFDVSAVRDGRLIISQETMTGHDMIGLPKVDVRSIGAGGGSIAWVDQGGLIRVGPHSSSARPGPACYGHGGTEPTVTDANLVLGLLDADRFLGGKMKLDFKAAEKAMSTVAEKLGIGIKEAAYAVFSTSNHNMVAAIEDITVLEGIDPRESLLVVGGGATGSHIAPIAREMGIDRFMIPRFASGLSAFGGLVSDIKWESSFTAISSSENFDVNKINAGLTALYSKGQQFLRRSGVPVENWRFEYSFFGRYAFQSWEIEVPIELTDPALQSDDVNALASSFHKMHERIYAVKDENDTVEFVTWKVRAIGVSPQSSANLSPSQAVETPEPIEMREVFLPKLGIPRQIPVFANITLAPGAKIMGPAILLEDTTSVLLLNGMNAEVDAAGNIMVQSS
ncbi:Acetophenone carboxylase gamma subunit [Ensifer psoraleae]|uniref:hydantoinase/oxoprolinase family protein n=1 Tax=Sinorhizobium psoraleae TaxID=520838 RepID=UPI001567E34B|nr:hydantoinase/oxoprolinase family protein [Sinorhizobium psoraleae]NRP75630.1 Acetophenone carboxylase gamma subunit [Sinorhizobium psoraleae]